MNIPNISRLVGSMSIALGTILVVAAEARAVDPPQRGGRGPDPATRADQAVFHELLEKHEKVDRTVQMLPDGVETLTESDDPAVAAKIQEHVAAMHARIRDGRGLRHWDELFAAIFRDHAEIDMTYEKTKKGVKVRETSKDRRVVGLIRAHSAVVSGFAAHGFDEAAKNHPVPAPTNEKEQEKEEPKPKLVFPIIAGLGGVVPLPRAAEPPRKGAKVVFDVTADARPTDVNKGLERVARLLNLYGAAGLKAEDVEIAVVFHGEATKSVLRDAAYAAAFQTPKNPNLVVLSELRKAGVKLFVCGQALGYKGFPQEDVSVGIQVAAAALTVVVNRQNAGFASIAIP
ncbi:MAG: DsrE family protein [Isosphaeraceae bacterium]|nr:DsrE family protein [Isosphaeraceae bacterium]